MKNKKGISIVEVVIAMGLLTLSIGGIMGVLVQSANIAKSIDYAYVANNLAKSDIEKLREIRRDRGYMKLIEMTGETTEAIDRSGNSEENGDFERTTKIEEIAGGALVKITVNVKYKRGGVFVPASTELVTLLSPFHE